MSAVPTRVALIACAAALAAFGRAQAQATPPAVPVEPIGAIVDAFKTHAIVALGEGDHGNEQAHAFRMALVRDARFAAVVNDIVVEFGNARFQDVMDRFIRGETVPADSLRLVWQDVTQAQATWLDSPIYEEFFRAVRGVNRSLARDKQIRVLLGDPPIDWSSVFTGAGVQTWIGMRDTFPADLIQREVLARHRKALLIWGDMHLQRRQILANYDTDGPAQTLISRLERTYKAHPFTIWTATQVDLRSLQGDVPTWHAPVLAMLRNTLLGFVSFATYYPSVQVRLSYHNGEIEEITKEEWKPLRMEDQFDAVLYIGPPVSLTFAPMRRELCTDSVYMQRRLARLALAGPPTEAARLRQYCGIPPRR